MIRLIIAIIMIWTTFISGLVVGYKVKEME